jgi:hypothetical protein
MFSPRAARGYRFHSLQVEIIFTPLAVWRRYHLDRMLQFQRAICAAI